MEDTDMSLTSIFSWPDPKELSTTTEGSTIDNIFSTLEDAAQEEIVGESNRLTSILSDSISTRFAEITDNTKAHTTTSYSILDGLFSNFGSETQHAINQMTHTDHETTIPSSTIGASAAFDTSSVGTTDKILETITEKATSILPESITTLLGDTEAPSEQSTIIISSTVNPSAGSEEFAANASSTLNSIINSTIETATNSGLIEESLNTTMSTLTIDENANSTISEVVTNTPVATNTSSIITELFTSEITSTTESSVFNSGNASEVTTITTLQPEVTETTTMQIITSTVNHTVEHSVKIEDDDYSTIYIIVGSVLILLVVLIIGMVFVYKRYNHKLSPRSGDYCVNQLNEVKTQKGFKNNESPAAKDCSNTRF